MNNDKGIRFSIILVFALAVTVLVSAPFLSVYSKNGGRSARLKPSKYVEIYVCGAVMHEGKYTLKENSLYRELFAECELYTNSHIGKFDYDKIITLTDSMIIIDFYEDSEIKHCVNINSDDGQAFLNAGIDADLFVKITANRGAGYNCKEDLKAVLTAEEYNYLCYRIYCI